MVSCPWALSFCIFIRFVFVFADVCVQSEKCGKIKFRWTRLGVGGADWSISRRGRSFSTSGSRPAPGNCPPRLSLSRSTQIQTRLVGSLWFRRLKYLIITSVGINSSWSCITQPLFFVACVNLRFDIMLMILCYF